MKLGDMVGMCVLRKNAKPTTFRIPKECVFKINKNEKIFCFLEKMLTDVATPVA